MNKLMYDAAESGRNTVSKHQIQLGRGDNCSRMTRDGMVEPVSGVQILRRERTGTAKYSLSLLS